MNRYAQLVTKFADLLILALIWDAITLTFVYRAFGVSGVVTSAVFETAGALLIIAVARRYDLSILFVSDSPASTIFRSDVEEESDEMGRSAEGEDYFDEDRNEYVETNDFN